MLTGSASDIRASARSATTLAKTSPRRSTAETITEETTLRYGPRSCLPSEERSAGSLSRARPLRHSASTRPIRTATNTAVQITTNTFQSWPMCAAWRPAAMSASCGPGTTGVRSCASAAVTHDSAATAHMPRTLRWIVSAPTRGRLFRNRMLVVARVLRRGAGEGVGAARRDVLAQLAAHRSHIGDELPDLVVGNASAERRHAVRPAFDDRSVDRLRLVAVAPLLVHQRRAHAAAAVGMAAAAVVPTKEPLALVHRERVFLEVRAIRRRLRTRTQRRAAAGKDRAHLGRVFGRGRWRRLDLALLSIAAGERHCKRCADREKARGHGLRSGRV